MDSNAGLRIAPLEVATRRLFNEDEKEQTEGIKDLWSLSCGEPMFAVAIGQSTTILTRLIELCRVNNSSSSSSAPRSLSDSSDSDQDAPAAPPSPQARNTWKKIVLGLHCLWNLSAYEENKQSFVLKGVVECVQAVLAAARWAIHEKQRNDALLCCAAIIQNLSESRFRSGACNQLQVRIVQEGALDALMFLADPNEIRDISVRFKACLALCNLAAHPQNRREIRRYRAFGRVAEFLKKENWDEALSRASIWGSFLVLQPFIPLLQLSPESRMACQSSFSQATPFTSLSGTDPESEGDPDFRYVQLFAVKCFEKFSSLERYHKKIWHDLAMNGGVQPLKELLRSSPDAEVRACVRTICRNLGVDLTDAGVSIGQSTICEDIVQTLNRRDMFPDLVISCITPPGQGQGEAVRQDILCHRAILAARCKVFATTLSWGERRNSWQAETSRFAKDKQVMNEGEDQYDNMRRIEVTEFDYGTMLKVLEYIYYDRTQLDWRCAVDVLRAADIYGLERLKQMCEDVIMQGIEADNLCDLLLVADMHSAPQLFRACINFICNYHEDLSASLALNRLLSAHPQLKDLIENEIQSRMANNKAKAQKDKEKDKDKEGNTEPAIEEPMHVV